MGKMPKIAESISIDLNSSIYLFRFASPYSFLLHNTKPTRKSLCPVFLFHHYGKKTLEIGYQIFHTESMSDAITSRDYLSHSDPEKHLYLKILHEFPALIWRSNTEGLCDYFNTTWLAFTGRSFEQEYGNGWAEGVHAEDLQRCVDYYFEHFHRREGFSMEYRLRHHSGEYRWILDLGRPFWGLQNEFLGFIGSCYDITEQRRLTDELKSLVELRTRILGVTGHDLRNMLSVIQGLGGLLRTEVEDHNWKSSKEFADLISSTAGNAIHLLSNLVDWAQSRTGQQALSLIPLDPCNTIRETVNLYLSTFSSKGLQVEMDLDTSEGALIQGNPDYLATLIRNLLSNAVKFTPRGGRIRVQCLLRTKDQDRLLAIVVSDTGVGMDSETLTLLQKGAPIHSHYGTEEEGGSGLGLSICSDFLHAMGGTMEIESNQGKGTSITLVFPQLGGTKN